MSYSLIPYSIELKKLLTSVGSKKKALVEAVIKGNPKRFKAETLIDEVSFRGALTHLIMGESQNDDRAHRARRLAQGGSIRILSRWGLGIRFDALGSTPVSMARRADCKSAIQQTTCLRYYFPEAPT